MRTNVKSCAGIFRLAFLILLCGLATAPLAAQSTASILGAVTDSSGAAVPEASIRATNIGTGAMQVTTSDSGGRYRLSNLVVGQYDVQTEKSGFQTVLHKKIELTVGGETVVDFALPVGQLTQTVTVEGEASRVETTSAAISNLVEQAQIKDLPLNGRNFEQLIVLAPGVLTFTAVTRGAFYGRGDSFTVSGSRPNGQQMLLDNTDVMDYENRGSGAGILGTSMGVDAIAEFQTLTNTYGAQYGGNGAVVNSVSKSGTNAFHGSAYEFARNSALDSRDFFERRVNPGETRPHPAPFNRNQFGATIGGPIKRDKLFFFANYEGLRQGLGLAQEYVVLDDLARQGYAPVLSATGVPTNVVGQYRCLGLANGNTPLGSAQAGPAQPGSCVVPANIAPVLNFYSTSVERSQNEIFSKGLPTGTSNLSLNAVQPGTENYVLGRVDLTISEKDSFYGRYLFDFANLSNPLAGSFDLWPDRELSHNQFFTMEEKHIYSNNLVGTTRFAYMRPLQEVVGGLKTYPAFEAYPGTGLPDVRIGSLGTSTSALGPIRQNPLRLMYNKFHVGEDIIFSRATHTLRFGAALTRNQIGAIQNAPDSGEWTFSTIQKFLQGFADRYNGLNPTTTLANGQVIGGLDGQRDWREFHYATYLQDDWKVRPNLTLNIGLRWSPTSNPWEIHNKMTAIIPVPMFEGSAPCSPAYTGPQPYPAGVTCSVFGTVITPGFSPVSRVYAKNASLRNIDPRIGFAWDPFNNGKMSIRGGYGIFHAVIEARDYEPAYALVPPYALFTARGATSDALPFSTLAPVGSGIQTQQLGWNRNTTHTPYMQQWNITVQREIMKNTVVMASYVGSHGLHFYASRDENPPIPIANPSYNFGLQFATCTPSPACLTGPGSGTQLPSVNPFFGFTNAGEYLSWSKYNSFQAALNRRLTSGWQLQVSYTKSACTDIGSGSWGLDRGTQIDNPYDPSEDAGRCGFDQHHSIVANSMYQLPFRGNKLITGWQVGGIFVYRTGLPVNVTTGFIRAFDNAGGGSNRPNYVAGCDPVLPDSARFPASGNPTWVNPACFTLPRIGELGNTPRDFVNGPRFVNVDTSLLKTTAITEKINIQFRAEFFNVLNHPNFSITSATIFQSSGTISPTAGTINSTIGTARQIQFGVKLLF
jgi:hypothetical protein